MDIEAIEKAVAVLLLNADRYRAYMRLFEVYFATNDAGRTAIRLRWDFGGSWTYPDPVKLACVKGEECRPREKIGAVLMFYDLDKTERDDRDDTRAFALAYHACLLSGLDARTVFCAMAHRGKEAYRGELAEFLQRTGEDISMDAFGLRAELNQDYEWEIRNEY